MTETDLEKFGLLPKARAMVLAQIREATTAA